MLWTISAQESGLSLLNFLKSKITGTSARKLKRILESNHCLINGRIERFGSFVLGTGDKVELLNAQLFSSPRIQVAFESERVLYEDNHFFIYNKPSGIASDSPALLSLLKRDLPYLALAHRLDRDTTGVLIFAKSELALENITALFKTRSIEKSYLAIVDGIPDQASGTIDNYLGILKRYQGQSIWGSVLKEKGLHAITEWQCEAKGKEASLLKCFPKTGRTHQLRVHLSSIGHPILGDSQYSRRFRCAYLPPRCMLHAESVSFINPYTNKFIQISAPIPADFDLALKEVF